MSPAAGVAAKPRNATVGASNPVRGNPAAVYCAANAPWNVACNTGSANIAACTAFP